PANLEGHEALATVLGQDPAAEAALRRALVLSPWSPEVRDRLALQLWARGARQEGAAELEESMFRFPSLSSHAYLTPARRARHAGRGRLRRAWRLSRGGGRAPGGRAQCARHAAGLRGRDGGVGPPRIDGCREAGERRAPAACFRRRGGRAVSAGATPQLASSGA